MNRTPQLVAFDLFGTLIRYGVMHHPYRKILKWSKENGRKPLSTDARQLMTINADHQSMFAQMGIFPPQAMLDQLHNEIQEELDDLTLFNDVIPVLDALSNKEIRLALCSNLAKPYGAVIEKLLFQYSFIQCLSFEVGAIKPEDEIYEDIVNKSGVLASDILFVGDTLLADFEGPSRYGFNALHLQRSGDSLGSVIQTLGDIFY